jgi:NTP pyrophosphatase (non-canonical NTP hydrolase)
LTHHAEPVAVPLFAQTCLVWIRFSSTRHERLPDSGEPFFYLTSPLPSPNRRGEKEEMDIKQLTEEMNRFVRSKGWYEENSQHPQTPRNLAISLTLEAAEILEHFQWHEEVKDKEELASELADVALYLLELASVTEIDLEQAVLKKLEFNKTREWDTEELDVDHPMSPDV